MPLKSVYNGKKEIKSTIKNESAFKRSEFFFLDNNSTTPILPEVKKTMEEFYFDNYANTSSNHKFGMRAKESLETSRAKMASYIGAAPQEVIFTSGASESLNLAIFGQPFLACENCKGKVVVTAASEHHASLYPVLELKKYGAEVIVLNPDSEGIISPADFEKATANYEKIDFTSIMMVNNETGVIQPIKELTRIAKSKGSIFLCDCVQAFGKLPINVSELGIDMLALSAHKFYGPKGTGILYIKRGTKLNPRILGGSHEFGMRAGTVNTQAIAGMETAARLAISEFEHRNNHYLELRNYLYKNFEIFKNKNIEIKYNSPKNNSVASTINVSFKNTPAETLLEYLSEKNIMVSAGSACNSKKGATMSHVISAMNVPFEFGMGALRISLGIYNETYDIDRLTESILEFYQK
ncbi:MAG: cysteine desulfurase family protein [Candidatus Wallbacteria bacterium]